MPRRNKGAEREIALVRIRKLLTLAGKGAGERQHRYVTLARRIAMRYQVSLPADLRRRVCRECEHLLVPGRTARVRLSRGILSISCLHCGAVRRYPYARGRGSPR